jgi:hypothetical protein
MGTDPPRLTRLPPKSRSITCVVLEYAMVSYAGLWENGRYTWEIRHDSRQGLEHLELSGDLPQEFERVRNAALEKQRTQPKPQATYKTELPPKLKGLEALGYKIRKTNEMLVDYVFNVPLDMAAAMTGYRYGYDVESDFFRSLRPTEGDVLTKRVLPPKWWQTVPLIFD